MFFITVDEEIRLQLVSETLAPRYLELLEESREYLSRWLPWTEFCNTEEGFRAFAKKSLHDYADGKSLTCAIEFQENVVGNISLNTIRHDLKMVEVGYWLGEPYQGSGIITRACRYLCHHAFNNLGMEKVQISAAEENLSSRAVCERLGMTLEGVISHREKVGDKVLSHAIYGLQRPEVVKQGLFRIS
ncbi:GNAT family N-acetyltransferase [Endozoicomonas sp. 8E]|uniref:GNAT family N-acetyltransferase n=1 Tax=Endozoicomonas sp. 8E TaxID=3035692 RepID=UPI0029390934|nr:GNAT family N-acetyltransferase [Endozoicomonas sp. 8E]WOG25622.1 GNAT family N-acetyltransferase [Endozoicomonas sp. 8E]